MGQGIRAGQTVSSIPYGFDRNGRPLRIWRKRKNVSLGEGFLYPIVDGPGIALLVFLPPFLAIMAFPVFDLMVHIKPGNALSPVALLIIPFTLPLIVSFALTIGYILIFFGRILSTTASGEDIHPKFPVWDRMEILEELARWFWAGMTGLAVGGLPAVVYWIHCGDIDWMDGFVLADLAIVGIAYAQLALVASLLHETITAANPVTVFRSIYRLGWDYLAPCVVSGLIFLTGLTAWSIVLLHSPNLTLGLIGLWACWVGTLYAAMVVFRTLGTLYYRFSDGSAGSGRLGVDDGDGLDGWVAEVWALPKMLERWRPRSSASNSIQGPPMYRVTREIPFCYGHRLINYDGKCRHLHGHNVGP